jgi:hypothetical protein
MTFAKNRTYGVPKICRNGNESAFGQNIGNSYKFPIKKEKFGYISKYNTTPHRLFEYNTWNTGCPTKGIV